MESFTADAAYRPHRPGAPSLILMDRTRLMFLATGCVLGLVLGIIPGIGGLAGTAMLLPFTFDMAPYTAFAFLLGLGTSKARLHGVVRRVRHAADGVRLRDLLHALEAKERWSLTIPWPQSVIGQWIPALKVIPTV